MLTIFAPKISQLPFELIIAGSLGYAVGCYGKVNEKLSTSVLMIRSLANYTLFYVADLTIRHYLNISKEALYTVIDLGVSGGAICAARKLDLLSRRMACAMVFASAALFTARLSILYSNSSQNQVIAVPAANHEDDVLEKV